MEGGITLLSAAGLLNQVFGEVLNSKRFRRKIDKILEKIKKGKYVSSKEIERIYLSILRYGKVKELKEFVEKLKKLNKGQVNYPDPYKTIKEFFVEEMFPEYINNSRKDSKRVEEELETLVDKVVNVGKKFNGSLVKILEGFTKDIVDSKYDETVEKVFEVLNGLYKKCKNNFEDFRTNNPVLFDGLVNYSLQKFFEIDSFKLPEFAESYLYSLELNNSVSKVINVYCKSRSKGKEPKKKLTNLLYDLIEGSHNKDFEFNKVYGELISKKLLEEVELLAEKSGVKLDKSNESNFLEEIGKESVKEWLKEATLFGKKDEIKRIATLFEVSDEVLAYATRELILSEKVKEDTNKLKYLHMLRGYFPDFFKSEEFKKIVCRGYAAYAFISDPKKASKLMGKLYEVTGIKNDPSIIEGEIDELINEFSKKKL